MQMDNPSYRFDIITGKPLIKPYCLAANFHGDVYVASYGDATLVRIPAGSLVPDPEGLPYGAKPNQLVYRVAVDGTSSDTMIVTYDAVYTVAGGNTLGVPITCPSRPDLLQALTDIVQAHTRDWYVCTANGVVIRIPFGSNEADPSPIQGGMRNCRGITVDDSDNLYVTDAGDDIGRGSGVFFIPDLGRTGPPRKLPGLNVVGPRPIACDDRVYIGNDVASSVSILDIQTLTQQPPNPLTGGGLFIPMRIIAVADGAFILNGNDTLTRIAPGADLPDPDPISGGGMRACRDVCYGQVGQQLYLWVSNADSNSITRITLPFAPKTTPTVALVPSGGTQRLPLTLTATVTGANNVPPTGNVQFKVDGAPSGTPAPLVAGSGSSSTAQKIFERGDIESGVRTIEADYPGDPVYGPAQASGSYNIRGTFLEGTEIPSEATARLRQAR